MRLVFAELLDTCILFPIQRRSTWEIMGIITHLRACVTDAVTQIALLHFFRCMDVIVT